MCIINNIKCRFGAPMALVEAGAPAGGDVNVPFGSIIKNITEE